MSAATTSAEFAAHIAVNTSIVVRRCCAARRDGLRGPAATLRRVEGFWPIFFLGVVLKVPVFMALYLVWWAARAETELKELPEDGDHGFRRWRSEPSRPRGPRRGAHSPDAQPLPDCPPGGRFRVVAPPAPVRVSAARERVPERR